jgi:DNA primase
VAAPQHPAHKAAPQRSRRTAPSGLRTLLRCLVMKPVLARELPRDMHADGADGAAIAAIADWLNESADETSTAAMIQHFQGTAHEAAFAAAQADIMHWGEEFDVNAEFAGALSRLREESRKAELDILNAKVQGKSANALNKEEQARYLQLLQRGQT